MVGCQSGPVAVTFRIEPAVPKVPVAFQRLVTLIVEGSWNFKTQGLVADPIVVEPLFVMVMLACKPPGHWFTTW